MIYDWTVTDQTLLLPSAAVTLYLLVFPTVQSASTPNLADPSIGSMVAAVEMLNIITTFCGLNDVMFALAGVALPITILPASVSICTFAREMSPFEKMTFPDGDSWTVFDRNRIYEGKDSPKLREYLKKKYGK